MKEDQLKKSPCTKCGELCFHLCYIKEGWRESLICVDCFGEACAAATVRNQKKVDHDSQPL